MAVIDTALTIAGAELLRSRWFVRLPIPAFRHGLGWVFGSRILMLQMRGRRSGKPRYVVVERVMRPDPDTIYIVSGFGDHSQWYRNLQADPDVLVSIGRIRSRPATAHLLTEDVSADLLRRYAAEHGAELRHLVHIIAKAQPDREVDLRLVQLQLASQAGRVPRRPSA